MKLGVSPHSSLPSSHASKIASLIIILHNHAILVDMLLINKTQLLSLLTLLSTITITTAVPTALPVTTSHKDSIDDNQISPQSTVDAQSQAQYTLSCHSGLSASICASQYSASCSDNGGFFSHPAEDGRSCTSRQCGCSR
ncbi:uncharacterized protein RCO7_15061 [Rhynchosporium graminicola]|uniref:Uncharacterized protein n=1 Tax=Rhynchosporium graminicola TaxID=2792576 RepID=A0A1E1LIH3_9HELO|nr:uncharacterized protein RCO7_15061 [Rhynchosporium commune]